LTLHNCAIPLPFVAPLAKQQDKKQEEQQKLVLLFECTANYVSEASLLQFIKAHGNQLSSVVVGGIQGFETEEQAKTKVLPLLTRPGGIVLTFGTCKSDELETVTYIPIQLQAAKWK